MTDYSSISIEDLVRLCSAGREPGAWEEFVRRFHRLIATVVLRTSGRQNTCDSDTVDDLIQETYVKLCANDFRLLKGFTERHPGAFLGYITVIAANVVRDHFRSTMAQKRGAPHTVHASDIAMHGSLEGSRGSPSEIERQALIEEIQRNLESCADGPEQKRNQTIFWLYYRTGLSAGAIAMLPEIGLTTKGVESIILRLTKEIRLKLTTKPRVTNPLARELVAEGIVRSETF